MKRLMVLLGMMAALLTVAIPAFAQFNATLTFQLTVEGVPPPGTTFFGRVPLGEGGPGPCAPLTDPDGDGVYTGSISVPSVAVPGAPPGSGTSNVTIVQGIAGQELTTPGGQVIPCTGPLSLIKDFGSVQLVDQTLSASVSFLGRDKELPKTGGVGSASLLALGGGALLVGGGLLARRLVR